MVDFGNSVFEGKLDPSVPLLNPVDDRSAETFAGALADGIDRFNKTVFSADAKASKADAAKNSFFAEYAEKVGLIADARDQGMGSDEALRNLRVAQNQFVSNHPELVDDFFTFSNKLMTENGFGGNIIKETPQESGERKMIEAGVQEGWDMNNPESVAAYKEQLNNKIYINQVADKVKMIEANGQIVSASVKAEAINGLHSLVATGTQWVLDQINGAYTKLEGVTDPALRQAIIDEVKAKVATQSAIIGQMRTQTNNAVDTSYMTSGIDTLVTNFENVATGKTTLDAVKTSNETIQAKNQALVMITNPKLAQLIALDGMSKFQLPGMMKELDSEMLTTYGLLNSQVTVNDDGTLTSDNKPPDVVDKVDNVAKVFDMLKQETTNLVKDGGADKEAVASQANKIVNIMRSTAKYGANDSDAKNFTAVVDFFADPTVGKFMETNASTMYPQVAAEARYVIEQQYDSVVIPLINERWTTATDQIKTSGKAGFAESLGLVGNQQPGTETITDASKVVEPYWNGVGIEMRPAKGFETNPQVREIVKGLNQGPDSITGPLNKLIRAKAHLSGTTDYEKVYNEGYKDKLWITGNEGDKKPATGSNSNELSTLTNIPEGSLKAPVRPTDYTETPTTLRGQTGQLLDAIGAAEGATYDTLFGYAEKAGGDFSGTDITNMTVNDVQSLQKEMVKKNGISSAVGKYQFIQGTLKEAIKGLGLKGDEKFTPELQDKLALWLLKNRTSYNDWATGSGDAAKFQNELASQWASIPNTSGKSAYAGDGVNNASAEGKRLIGML